MKVEIIQYKWEGSWGPFQIKIPCGECSVTEGVIRDVIEKEFPKDSIEFKVLPWLDNWWRIIFKGGWHAPVTIINGKIISQGSVIDRGLLAYFIRKELIEGYEMPTNKNIMFSKKGCAHCLRAKEILKKHDISYEERNIIDNALYAHQLFYLTKQFFPKNKPVTTPQIWLKGKYVGGADELSILLDR